MNTIFEWLTFFTILYLPTVCLTGDQLRIISKDITCRENTLNLKLEFLHRFTGEIYVNGFQNRRYCRIPGNNQHHIEWAIRGDRCANVTNSTSNDTISHHIELIITRVAGTVQDGDLVLPLECSLSVKPEPDFPFATEISCRKHLMVMFMRFPKEYQVKTFTCSQENSSITKEQSITGPDHVKTSPTDCGLQEVSGKRNDKAIIKFHQGYMTEDSVIKRSQQSNFASNTFHVALVKTMQYSTSVPEEYVLTIMCHTAAVPVRSHVNSTVKFATTNTSTSDSLPLFIIRDNSNPKTTIQKGVFNIGDWIHVTARMPHIPTIYTFYPHSCIAYSGSGTIIDLLDKHGCPVKDALSFNLLVKQKRSEMFGTQTFLKLKAFKFSRDSNGCVYLYCKAVICSLSSEQQCAVTCSHSSHHVHKRRARLINDNNANRRQNASVEQTSAFVSKIHKETLKVSSDPNETEITVLESHPRISRIADTNVYSTELPVRTCLLIVAGCLVPSMVFVSLVYIYLTRYYRRLL